MRVRTVHYEGSTPQFIISCETEEDYQFMRKFLFDYYGKTGQYVFWLHGYGGSCGPGGPGTFGTFSMNLGVIKKRDTVLKFRVWWGRVVYRLGRMLQYKITIKFGDNE